MWRYVCWIAGILGLAAPVAVGPVSAGPVSAGPVSAGAAGLQAAGGPANGQADEASAALTVYTARHYHIDQTLYDRFTKETGIAVKVVAASDDALVRLLQGEGAQSPADVLMTVDAGRLWRAQQAGVLQPIHSAAIERAVPAHFREPGGYWVGISYRARVLVYYSRRVGPADLTRYEDLADPKWRGRLLVDSSSSVYNQSLVGAFLAAHGATQTQAWLRGLVANFARPPQGEDEDQLAALTAGQGDVAVVNSYYFARLVASPDPRDRDAAARLGVIFPNQLDRGTHVNICGAGVTAHAPHRETAIRFLEYLVTPAAQRLFAESNYEYPVVPGVPVHPIIAAWGAFKEDTLNAAVYGGNNRPALALMEFVGWK